MKLHTQTAPVWLGLISLAAMGCESETEKVEAPSAEEVPSEPAPKTAEDSPTCTYAYDAEQTKLTWTAFKLTERAGVGGTFNTIDVKGTQEASEPEKVFEEMTFDIPTSGVNSENPERDAKIVAAFFGTLEDGQAIHGEVTSIEDGKGTLDLTLGGVTKPVELTYTVSDDAVLTAKGTIDLNDYQGGAAIAALNEVCAVQHKGEGKESKLWPDVELAVVSPLEKTCE